MSSLFTREWIALVILVATPMSGFAQRGGYDADTYSENNRGEARQEPEPPRLFRGGLMHQLRSVTESVLGSEEEEARPAAETNRNIPKPPPLSSQNQRNASGSRAGSVQGSRGSEPTEASEAPNRNWAGQFLVPNSRPRSQAPATRQPAPSQRNSNQRAYPGQRSAPLSERPSGASRRSGSDETDARANESSVYSDSDASGSSGGLSLEASSPPAESDEAIAMDKAPAEVVVSHVPDVPYVPRKPLPGRGQKSSTATSGSSGDSESRGASVSTKSSSDDQAPTNVASPAKPSAPASLQSETSPSFDAPSEVPTFPSIPSLEGTTLPGLNAPLPSSAPAASASSAANVPSLNMSESSAPATGSPAPSSPQLSPALGGESTGSTQSNSVPTLSLPDASAGFETSPTISQESSATAGKQERMHMEIPHVAVKLLGPGDLATGTPTGYELVVQNADRIALSGLILRMETPPGVEIVKNPAWGDTVELEKVEDGATLLMWTVGQVPAGGSTQLALDLKATTSRNFAVAIEWTVLPQEGIDELTVKQPDLQVALEGPVDVEKDVPNVYRVRVSNPGNAPARNVKVQVGAAAQQASQVEIGDLGAGQSEVVEMDLTFEKAGRLEIGANALAEGNLKRNTNIVVNVRQPVLHASLSMPKSILLGGNVFATMELRNTGDGPARKVQAGLMIPTDAEVVNPPSGVTREGDKLLWEVEIVPPGQLVTVPIELRLPNPGTQALKFACVTPAGALTTAEASTTVEAFADLKLLVNDPPTPAPIGAPVVYELTVTNRGTRDARNVTILAQFSEGIEPESATGLKNRVVPGQVLFDAIPTIAAGETVKIKLTAKASEPGMHRFRAEVRCEESDARLVEEESTRYLESASRIASPPSALIQR